MYIIEVIPIAKSIGTDTLSYFTSKEIPQGAIVDIPLRKKIVQGIVVSVRSAEDIKSEIKNASFELKKLDKVKAKEFLSESFMNMAQEISDYYATSIGSVIKTLVPDYILKNVGKLKAPKNNLSEQQKIDKINKTNETNKIEKKVLQEKYIMQGDDDERFGAWKSLVRQEFAKKKSVLFIFPTIEDTEHAFELLEKGVPGYVFILNGSLTPKKIIETWNTIATEPHPVVVIATGGFFSIARPDIETIVVERESSKAYKIPRRPYLDIRHVAEVYAEKIGIKIFFADNFLKIETLYRESQGELVASSPFKFRSLSTATDVLIDMKVHKTTIPGFIIFSEEVDRLIKKTKDESEHMIILATRRGLSPSTVCGDCQTIVVCNNCSAPVVLHKSGDSAGTGNSAHGAEKNFFMCHHCGERRSAAEYCKHCNSWKLGALGIGIDTVIEKMKEKFPDISIFKIDSDSTKTRTAKSIVQKFKAKPGSILVGTEMMLQYIHDKVENSAIISLDSLFALPDFRIQEKILYMLIRMRAITTKIFIAQTRKIDEKVFEYGLKGNMSEFYKSTIEERKKFNYPPFSTLIKLTLEGKKDQIVKEMEEAQSILDPYEVEIFPAFTNTVRGNFVLHGLIRISNSNGRKWPHNDLVDKLKSLSPAISVRVDPETLL